MELRELTADDVEFELIREEEWLDPSECFEDEGAIAWVREQAAKGNEWAWFAAKVVARWNGFEGVDYLGACSYESEEDFRACPYFEDLKAQALDDLNWNIYKTAKRFKPLILRY